MKLVGEIPRAACVLEQAAGTENEEIGVADRPHHGGEVSRVDGVDSVEPPGGVGCKRCDRDIGFAGCA